MSLSLKSAFLFPFILALSFSCFAQAPNFSTYEAALAWLRSSAQDLPTAAPIFDQYIEKAIGEGQRDSAALLTHYKAVKYYRVDIDSPLVINELAIAMREALKDIKATALSRYNQALFYRAKGDPVASAAQLEEVLNLGFSEENTMFVNSSYRLSQGERDRGDYERALHYLDLAYQPLQEIGLKTTKDSSNLALLDHAYATIYNQMTDSTLAVKAKSHLLNEVTLYRALGADNKLAPAYFELGSAYENLHQYDSAIVFFHRAEEAYAALGDDEMVNNAQNNLSIPYRKLGNYNAAIQLLKNSLSRHIEIQGAGPHPAKARLHDNLGEVYLAQGQLQQAIGQFQQAIANVCALAIPGDMTQNPSLLELENNTEKEDLLTYLRDKARCWKAFYTQNGNNKDLQNALEVLKLADYLVDLMRAEHLDQDSKLFWREQVHQIYEEGLAICYLLKDAEQAYYFLEKSRAVLLLDALVEADTRQWIAPELAETENEINQSMIALREQLKEGQLNPSLQKELLDQQKALQGLREKIRQSYPAYYDLRYKTTQIALDTFQALLAEDQAVIQFFYGEDAIYALSLQVSDLRLLRFPKNTVNPLIWEYLSFFEGASAILNAPKAYQTVAHQLFQALLAPIELNSDVRRLTLMLDGVLHNLPFEALLTNIEEKASMGQWAYLHQKYELSHAYSATILAKQMANDNGSTATPGTILAMAPFAEQSTTTWPSLTFSQEELKQIAGLIDGEFLFDAAASRTAFMESASSYAVLHLSTHASVNAKEGQPYIDFGEEKVYLSRLYQLRLPAQLVVLSACQTSLGELKRGEGVMSLNRGFTYAGAKSLISSLWKVNDRATAQIFAAFYQQLSKGASKASALHQAKSNYLAKNSVPDEEKSPYYWAGFIQYGDDSPLILATPKSKVWSWTGYGVLALFLIFLFGRFRPKSTAS